MVPQLVLDVVKTPAEGSFSTFPGYQHLVLEHVGPGGLRDQYAHDNHTMVTRYAEAMITAKQRVAHGSTTVMVRRRVVMRSMV